METKAVSSSAKLAVVEDMREGRGKIGGGWGDWEPAGAGAGALLRLKPPAAAVGAGAGTGAGAGAGAETLKPPPAGAWI
jgi:hypothetical protein